MVWGEWGCPQGTGDLTRWWDQSKRHRRPDPSPTLMLTGCGRRGDTVNTPTPPKNQVSAQGGHKATCKRRAESNRERDGRGRRVCKGNHSTSIY